tara:strand:- start:4133 stop:4429 length:297 start_codon:yes stop_codon:yes gene_type:complete
MNNILCKKYLMGLFIVLYFPTLVSAKESAPGFTPIAGAALGVKEVVEEPIITPNLSVPEKMPSTPESKKPEYQKSEIIEQELKPINSDEYQEVQRAID